MNKIVKIFIAIILAITLIVGGYYLIYLPYFCNITISIAKPMNAKEHYFQDIMLIYSDMPGSKIPLAEEITDTHQEFKKDFYEDHKDDEFHIEVDIVVEKGKTTIIYQGTITDNETCIEQPYEKEFVHDFVLTKDIQ